MTQTPEIGPMKNWYVYQTRTAHIVSAHPTRADAERAAKHCAQLHRTERYLILEAVASVSAQTTTVVERL